MKYNMQNQQNCEAVKQPLMNLELEKFDKALTNLEEEMACLNDRLKPIRSLTPEVPSKDSIAPPERTFPALVDRIRNMRKSVENQAALIRTVRSELEI